MPLPSIQFAAPLIRAAIATLERDMPGQVAAFNAEPANEVELEQPQTYWFGGQDLLAGYPFPQIEVAVVAGSTGNWAISRSEVDHDPRLNVAVWLEGDKGEIPTLYEKTLGLTRCVIECLAPVGAFGPEVEIAQETGIQWRCDVIPVDPTATSDQEGRDFQRWRASGLIQFGLEVVERFA